MKNKLTGKVRYADANLAFSAFWRYNYKKSKVKNLTPERVVDSLQRYVCERHGRKSGSYSYFVQQLENDFLWENLSILLEYGLSCSSVHKLTRFLPEDEVLNYIIKNKFNFNIV